MHENDRKIDRLVNQKNSSLHAFSSKLSGYLHSQVAYSTTVASLHERAGSGHVGAIAAVQNRIGRSLITLNHFRHTQNGVAFLNIQQSTYCLRGDDGHTQPPGRRALSGY